ncbi:hypothetical protein DPEC_G00316690 [Dallia pectoralis]|uniref:Uncharacterized protein n=1 Tax=Dallia pectoralis TaxID=75939 RepID=A0ACC2FCN1_DALPE|nr:hypothetical protein DPEC_G00316690 [Dallia pectoralis]
MEQTTDCNPSSLLETLPGQIVEREAPSYPRQIRRCVTEVWTAGAGQRSWCVSQAGPHGPGTGGLRQMAPEGRRQIYLLYLLQGTLTFPKTPSAVIHPPHASPHPILGDLCHGNPISLSWNETAVSPRFPPLLVRVWTQCLLAHGGKEQTHLTCHATGPPEDPTSPEGPQRSANNEHRGRETGSVE